MLGGPSGVPLLLPTTCPFFDPLMSDPLLRAEAVTKAYDTGGDALLQVLRGVDLDVFPGEIVAVMGESGTGKSTLLHILGALERPTSGTIYFADRDLSEESDEALAAFRNRSIGFVFQFHHLLPEFSALENVAMPALIQHRGMNDAEPRALALLDALGLADRASHRPNALSGGEKQRVAVARALMNEPALVLMDEPTGNLDAQTADPLHREIERLSDEFDQAFVLVTHNPALASIADRVLRLEHGTLHPASAQSSLLDGSPTTTSKEPGPVGADTSGESRPDASST